ncbi:hypothetical protein ACSBOB_16760 [Mesorhizobium sp. ASY16-5R]|uniref:hypothetical protein n=1 Tax=Mesorhizobium sp. ASY16-5R TaxID=3445772 RepID=UPI003F9FCDDF
MSGDASEKLFSYGTLRLADVQLATFGRLLEGREDTLPGFALSMIAMPIRLWWRPVVNPAIRS